MFEFGRACIRWYKYSEIFMQLLPIHSAQLLLHFTVSGFLKMGEYIISWQKLVLISWSIRHGQYH